MDDCYWDGREILISQMHSREDGTDSCNVLVKGSQLHLWKNTKDEKIKESVNILWVRERESRIGVAILMSLEKGWWKEHTGRRGRKKGRFEIQNVCYNNKIAIWMYTIK